MSKIEIKPSHRGLLHEKLHIPEGEKIPSGKLTEAKNSSSPGLRKEAIFAQNSKSWNKR